MRGRAHVPPRPRSLRDVLPIRTERLVLRAGREDDVESVLEYCSSHEVTKYLPFGPLDREGVAARVARWSAELDRAPDDDLERDWAPSLIVEHGGRLVGDVMLRVKAGAARSVAEVGYVFDPAHGGQGLATEATRAVVDLAFAHLGCHRVFATVDPRNVASSRLCARLGMIEEAHLRRDWWDGEEWVDTAIWGILREKWIDRHRPPVPPPSAPSAAGRRSPRTA